MLKYFLRRVAELIPKIIIISIIIFLALQLAPGDPITRVIPIDKLGQMSQEQIEAKRELLGLNDGLIEQYFRWISGVVQGDFGYSQTTGVSVSTMISERIMSTFELALFGLIISTVLGLLMGYISALKQSSPIDYINTSLAMLGISVPEFFFGLVGILIFGIALKWLPTGGRMGMEGSSFFQRLKYIIMPAITLGVGLIALLMRFTRGSMLDILNKDYIKTARSKGLPEYKVNFKHCFRNALIPIIVVLALRIPMLVGGVVVIEAVFNYPGMGGLLLRGITGADMTVVMAVTLIITIAILFASFIADILTSILDPRIRLGNTNEVKQ